MNPERDRRNHLFPGKLEGSRQSFVTAGSEGCSLQELIGYGCGCSQAHRRFSSMLAKAVSWPLCIPPMKPNPLLVWEPPASNKSAWSRPSAGRQAPQNWARKEPYRKKKKSLIPPVSLQKQSDLEFSDFATLGTLKENNTGSGESNGLGYVLNSGFN